LTYPLYAENTGVYAGSMIVAESLEPVERTLRILERLLLFASPIGLVLSAFGGWFLAGRALNPVDKITTTAASIATGSHGQHSLATRLEVPNTGDEIARLATTFNQMLDRLEETFNAQRRFVADASHELRTPLTAIRGNIDVMIRQLQRGEVEAGDLSDAMGDVRRESARMSRLIEDLLALARVDAPPDHMRRLMPIRVDEFVSDAMRTATGLAAGQHLHVAPLPSATIVADRDRMTELLLILLDNAIRHTPPGGSIVVSVEQSATTIRLSVRDTGEGIAPEDLPHVFDRFYRAGRSRDRATGGTGLGLAIAQSIARLHGGEITVASTLGSGSTFTVTLPRAGLPSEDLKLAARSAA
jgi:signal transduction histidine kinase